MTTPETMLWLALVVALVALLSKVQSVDNAVSAFANCGRAVAHVAAATGH